MCVIPEWITAVSTMSAVGIAYWQLNAMNKISRADFIIRLKDDFFKPETREIIELLDNQDMEFVGNDINKACFQKKSDEKRQLTIYEMDDLLLGKFEDIGIFLDKRILDIEMVYHEFEWYVTLVWTNIEIQKYIVLQRQDGDDMYCKFENLYNQCKKIRQKK